MINVRLPRSLTLISATISVCGEVPSKIHSLHTPSVLHVFIFLSLHTSLTKGALYKHRVFSARRVSFLLVVLSHGQLVKENRVVEAVHSLTRWGDC